MAALVHRRGWESERGPLGYLGSVPDVNHRPALGVIDSADSPRLCRRSPSAGALGGLVKGGLVLTPGKLRAWAAALAAVMVGGALPLAAAGPAAHAASSQVLILDASVTGGASSLEAQEVTAQGLTPVVVNDATWEGMTTSQFASYRAIVIGDPSCNAYGDTSYLTAALSNPGTWGAAVNGNVLIIGTDPVLHSAGDPTSGPGRLVSHGIDFALAQAGKTGAYIDLSCAYGDDPANTPVTCWMGSGLAASP